MEDDDLSGHLERLGERFDFGEYEIEAYLTVLDHGKLTASEIAEKTDIPQPRVYDTVRSLADDGFVELRDSRPLEVLAVDPEEAFDNVRVTLDDLVEDLTRQYTSPSRDVEAVWLVTSRQTILRYLEDVIAGAEYELVLSLSPRLLGRFEEQLAARQDEGVSIELLVSPGVDVPDPEEFDYTRLATVVRARRGLTTPIVAVADGTYSVYTTRTALHNGGDDYGVVFNRSELGFLVLGFLNTVVWPSARTLVESQEAHPFPRRYATIRRCVRDLQNSDGQFYASVRGRDVESGDPRSVEGEIVDIEVSTNRQTAAITLDTDDGTVDIGGQAAAFEDVEAYELVIDRESPPGLGS
ncbi:MAG: TrmB family transcriptional regulator [Halovenus sp.]